MKEFKGTKGVWKLGKSGIVYSDNGAVVAICYTGDKDCISDENKIEANAKLIAAAPELLEALQNIVKHSDLIIPKECALEHEDEIIFLCTLMQEARKAITKALGE